MRADVAIAGADLAAGAPMPPASAVPRHYETVLTREALDAWAKKVEAAPLVAFDVETDSLDPMTARIIGISLAVAAGEAAHPAAPQLCRRAGAARPSRRPDATRALAETRRRPRSGRTSSTTRRCWRTRA